MKLLLGILILLPAFGQAPAESPVPAPAPEEWLTGSIDLGYRWRTDIGGSANTYRSVVNLGSGPKLLGTEFTLIDPNKRFFDRIDVRAYDWGDDPYSTLHVNASKKKLYDLNVDYRNIAYFDNLPSFADPLLSRGIVLNEQSIDTRRRFTSVQLDLIPGNWFVPYFAFDRDSDSGTGVNAFVAGGNEYPVPTRIRNSANNYRTGVRFEFSRFHVTLEQGGITYKDDQSSYYTPAAANLGNNRTPLLGTVLDLTSLLQAYGIRGTSLYSKGLFTASAAPWLDLYGQFLFSQPDNKVNYQQYDTGSLANASTLLFYTGQQYLLSAEAKLPHTSASVGAEIRPFRRMRILQSLLTDRLHNSSSASAAQTIVPAPTVTSAASLLASSLASNYSQEQIDVFFDLTSKITLRGGYRYVWGDARDVILPIAELAGYEQGKLRRNVGIGGVIIHPTQKISANLEVEGGASDSAYFRTSLYNYQKVRALGRYQVTPALQVAAAFSLLNNQNPTGASGYDYLAHQESLSVTWSPLARKWDVQASYSHSMLRSDISYLEPELLQPAKDSYRDNSHSVTLSMDAYLPAVFSMVPRLSIGGSVFISSGSRPTTYYQPLAKLVLPVKKNLAWVSEWRYYGVAENFYVYENFRAHLVTTGLRFTR